MHNARLLISHCHVNAPWGMHLVVYHTKAYLQSSQFFTGTSIQVIHLSQTDIQVSQPERKLLPLCLKLLPL